MDHFVLDACSVIAFFEKEPGYEKVKELLERANEGQCIITMNKLNALEIYYGLYRDDSQAVAELFFTTLNQLPVLLHDVIEDNLFREAGKFKALYRISLADSIALAEAKLNDAYLVTSDHHEFDVIEKADIIRFYWIR